MVTRHEHDGQTTQKIDALEALLGCALGHHFETY